MAALGGSVWRCCGADDPSVMLMIVAVGDGSGRYTFTDLVSWLLVPDGDVGDDVGIGWGCWAVMVMVFVGVGW